MAVWGVVGLASLALASDPRDATPEPPSMPMPVPEEDTATHRWLSKEVLDTRTLDTMESIDSWSHRGFGTATLTDERSRNGVHALRLTSPTLGDKPGGAVGRPFGEAAAVRRFDREDWSTFDRISFWAYPSLPGFKVISILVKLYNDGAVKVPDAYNREGLHFVLLAPDRWNPVVWEIPHLARDQVTALELIYRLDGSSDPRYREQVSRGVRLDENHYLRRFPVWYDFRGNHGTVLSQTKTVSMAAHLRRNVELLQLATDQLEWILGRNPFCQSTMYGEGHDYAPQYTALSGDRVGSLPVGIQTRANEDLPYWPTANCYNYKEVWVHPSSRWLWVMADLVGSFHGTRASSTARSKDSLQWSADSTRSTDGTVTVEVTTHGRGLHTIELRADNLELDGEGTQTVTLDPEADATLRWTARVIAPRAPWVAVLIPDGDLEALEEVSGSP